MNSIALVGNITIDNINTEKGYTNRFGGVMNCARAYTKLWGERADVYTRLGEGDSRPYLMKKIEYCNGTLGECYRQLTSTADITLKKDGRTKEASVLWANDSPVIPSKEYDIIHVSYLNKLQMDMAKIADLNLHCKMLTADVCAGDYEDWKPYIPEVDVLFVAKEECPEIPDVLPRKCMIIHSRESCRLLTKTVDMEFYSAPLDDVYVLGAGDYFAMAVLNGYSKWSGFCGAIEHGLAKMPELLKELNDF